MGKLDRGRFSISTNILLTVALITRTLTFGLTMLIAYMKTKDAIFDDNVTRIMNLDTSYKMELGTAMRSIAYSIIGVFLMEFVTGVFCTLGALCKIKPFLVVTVILSSMMLLIYTIYFVLLALLYDKTNNIHSTLDPFVNMYWDWNNGNYYHMYISQDYEVNVFPGFLRKLGCESSFSAIHSCFNVYKEQVRTYLKTYFGVIIACFLCHIISIVASEYTYRKLEFKEIRTGLSRNKYYLLFTLRHGIGRTFLLFVRRSWRTSKIVFCSTVLKITSLVASIALFVLGLILRGDIMITNGSLKHIFYQIQFNQYYFYDILIGLSASAVVTGFSGAASSVLSMVASLRQSQMLKIASCILSTILLLPKIVLLVFWSLLIVRINNNMKYQLSNQQNGYYYNNQQNTITTQWNGMILALDCCGVFSHSDTHYRHYGSAFCCKVAHDFRMDLSGEYNNYYYGLEYYGGCGGYKTKTCNSAVLWKTNMYVGWLLGIIGLLIILEIISIILINKEYHIDHVEIHADETKLGRLVALKSFWTIFLTIGTGLKSFLGRYCNRSKSGIFHLISTAIVFVCCIALLSNAVRIRYDEIFGNRDIKPLLDRVNITGSTFIDAIDNFSTVVITFALATLVVIVYSISIMIPKKLNKLFSIVGFFMWASLIIANTIELGLWGKFSTEVSSIVKEQFENDIKSYRYSQRSGLSYYDQISFYWNTLFVKAKCCGTNSTSNLSFHESYWYRHNRDYNGQELPFQCCTTQTEIYPYDYIFDSTCRYTPNSYHEEDCPTVIEKRLWNYYSLPFFLLTVVVLIAEIIIVTSTVLSRRRTLSDDDKIELSIKDIKDQAPETDNGTNKQQSGTVKSTSTKPKPVKRESSRLSILSRSTKVRPDSDFGNDTETASKSLRGSLRKGLKRSLKRSVKKTADKSDVHTKALDDDMSEKPIDNSNEYGDATKGHTSKETLTNESENNNYTERSHMESTVTYGNENHAREDINKDVLPFHDSKLTNSDVDNKQTEATNKTSQLMDATEGNIGTLTSAWQTAEDDHDKLTRSFNPNVYFSSPVPYGSLQSDIGFKPYDSGPETLKYDMGVEEL